MFKNVSLPTLLLSLASAASVYGQTPGPLTADAKMAWSSISGNLVKAAGKLPEASYSFRPVSGVRSFGELIGHVTDAHYMFCSMLQAAKKPGPDAEKKLTAKSDLVAALKG